MVTPTLREAGGIAALAERIAAAMSAAGLAWELIVVDEDSADGIDGVVDALARTLPVRLAVRTGPGRSLSASVLMGIELCRAERIVVMDADLSHPPERIAAMLDALDASSSVGMVVGSRYMPGGELSVNWGWHRRLISRAGTLAARPLVRCADPLSGFFAVRRAALPDMAQLRPVGYKIGLELMVRGGLSVAEVPISFRERCHGRSKFGFAEQVKFCRHLAGLYGCALRRRLGRAGRSSPGSAPG